MPRLVVLTADPALSTRHVRAVHDALGRDDVDVHMISLVTSPAIPPEHGHVALTDIPARRDHREERDVLDEDSSETSGASRLRAKMRELPPLHLPHDRDDARRTAIDLVDWAGLRPTAVKVRRFLTDAPGRPRRPRAAHPVSEVPDRMWRLITASEAAMALVDSADAVAALDANAIYAAWRIATTRPDLIVTRGVSAAVLELEVRHPVASA